MAAAGNERRRQILTAGIGTALTLVMGAVLVMGFRLATHMRADITALQTASRLQAYPMRLDDLLLDPRYPNPHRYLRKIWLDPITGSADWGLVQGPNGEIFGVYSRSQAKPIKQANFSLADAAFEGKDKYSDWQFVYIGRNNPIGGQAPAGAQGQTPTGPNRITPYQRTPSNRPITSPMH